MTGFQSYQWVRALASCYRGATADADNADLALQQQLHTVTLASAALDKLKINVDHPAHRRHIAVIGPTQSGKSTLVNILLDTRVASVSPLAGFTVHTQGYGRNVDDADAQLVQHMLAPLIKTSAAQLNSEQLECYALESVTIGADAMSGDALVWDTPDFDSISADDYSLAVLKTAAIADVAVLMVSKDKYGDKRVWDMLALLNGLGKSLMVCINKVDQADRSTIEQAFTARYNEIFQQSPPPLVLLPYTKNKAVHHALPLSDTAHKALQHALDTTVQQIDRGSMDAHFSDFVSHHEAQWLQPLLDQLDAKDQWHSLIVTAIKEADDYYARNYLDSPDKYDTFNRALAELLSLLEIPGIATRLVQARQVITWPARRLLGVGKQALGNSRNTKTDAQGDAMDQEALVLERMLEQVLIALQRHLLEAPAESWWRELDRQFRKAMPAIRQHYLETSKQARESFEIEIEKAAGQLYQQLEKQPTLLNSLRAARVTADAAAVALAVKSGGLAPTDLVLAPAMLSVTTLLTENALGRYLDTVKRDLKNRQRLHIKAKVLEAALQLDLMQLSDEPGSTGLIADKLPPELYDYLQRYRQQRK